MRPVTCRKANNSSHFLIASVNRVWSNSPALPFWVFVLRRGWTLFLKSMISRVKNTLRDYILSVMYVLTCHFKTLERKGHFLSKFKVTFPHAFFVTWSLHPSLCFYPVVKRTLLRLQQPSPSGCSSLLLFLSTAFL